MIDNLSLRINNPRKSFTLIELLVVLALVAILSVVVVITLNPAELIKQARDSNRLSDLSTINTALNLFSADVTSGFMGTSTVVYVSMPDTSPTCANLGLPALPTSTVAWTYGCVTATSTRNTNGTGWIPVNFQRISSNSPISQLPVDPINTTSSGNYYTYVTGGSWMLSAVPESVKQKTELSTNPQISKYPGVIGMGNNLDLSPLYNPSGLIGYWKFDGDARDYSGNGNHGTWYGTSTNRYATGKVGSFAGYFNGSTDGVEVNSFAESSFSITAWMSPNKYQNYSIYNRGWIEAGGILIYGNAMTDYNFSIWNSSGTRYNIYSNYTFQLGQWNFLSVTFDASSGRMTTYLNGFLRNTSEAAALGAYSLKSYIGKASIGAYYFPGSIDDLRVYGRVLSAAEVLAQYNATR